MKNCLVSKLLLTKKFTQQNSIRAPIFTERMKPTLLAWLKKLLAFVSPLFPPCSRPPLPPSSFPAPFPLSLFPLPIPFPFPFPLLPLLFPSSFCHYLLCFLLFPSSPLFPLLLSFCLGKENLFICPVSISIFILLPHFSFFICFLRSFYN